MKNLNRKGFTLVELMIAISILGIVFSIGYGIINSSNKYIKEQSDIFSGQMSVNTAFSFITKDLEQSKSFEGPLDMSGRLLDESRNELQNLVNRTYTTKTEEYYYKIITNDTVSTTIEYKVIIHKDEQRNKYDYDVVRKKISGSNVEEVEILSKQPINFSDNGLDVTIEIPYTIKQNLNNFHVELGYEHNGKQNRYKSSASSRYL